MNSLIKREYFTMDDCNINLLRLIEEDIVSFTLTEHIKQRYEHNWIIYEDAEISPWDTEDVPLTPDPVKVEQWSNRFKFIYETTKRKYLKLFDLYQSEETNLLSKIGSTVTNKFNDTPQNLGVGELDDYTSTLSKTTTEVDPGEIINRIENIRNNYKNLYVLWVEEFNSLFGENTLL